MKEFTQAVGGDAIHVVSLIPEGTEPHGFSPTADQMKTLHNAKLLIVHGLGMEPWAQKSRKHQEIPIDRCRGL